MIGKKMRQMILQLLLIFYILEKWECPAYISKVNSNCEKQTILLMIPDEEREGWYYLAVKKTSVLPKRIA